MSRSAGNSWHTKAGALAMLLPLLALTACASGSQDQAMSEKLAAAEAAANKAIEAQHAAEKAAATAASVRAPAPEPTLMAPEENSLLDEDNSASGDHGDVSHRDDDNSANFGSDG
jgi:hypothetical protein